MSIDEGSPSSTVTWLLIALFATAAVMNAVMFFTGGDIDKVTIAILFVALALGQRASMLNRETIALLKAQVRR